MRVVIADRDAAFLETLQSFLWFRGHDAETATNSLDCLDAMREFHPDVVVLESGLLVGDGDRILNIMAEDPTLREIPAIMVAESPESAVLAGAFPSVGWLPKPFRLGELLQVIELAGDSRHRGRRPDPPKSCFYTQCLVCGRSLQAPIDSLGQPMRCGHCGGTFVAVARGDRAERRSDETVSGGEGGDACGCDLVSSEGLCGAEARPRSR
jgi:CheY-like chemotaxis protein